MEPNVSLPRPVTSIKAALMFICLAAQKLATVDGNKDGKVNAFELFGLMISLGPKVPELYKAIPNILPELHDITDDEMVELHEFFKDQFDLPNDKAEAVVEKSIEILHQNFIYYQDLRDILKQ